MEVVEESKLLGSETVGGLAVTLLPWLSGIANRVNRVLPKDGTEAMVGVLPLQQVNTADLPAASTNEGSLVYVKDADFNREFQFSNGANWISAIGWIYNVKDYGAKGGGVTDDSIAIRLTIAAGNNIYFPDGTYLVNQDGANNYAIAVASGKKLFGEGRGRSIIKLADSQDVTVFQAVHNATNVHFSSLEVDGNKANQTANGVFHGIEYLTSSLPTTGADVLVTNCYVHDCTKEGIRVGSGITNIQILGNRVKDCGSSANFGSGISMVASGSGAGDTGCDKVEIANNIVSGSGNADISCLAKNYSITGNVCFDSIGGDSISAYAWEGAKYGTITGNVSNNSGQHGIKSGGDYITIGTNSIFDAAGRGIMHASTQNDTAFSGVSIMGNTIKTTGSGCIEVRDVTTGASISGNHCEGATGNGILVNNAGLTLNEEITITGNVCKSNSIAGIDINDVKECVVSSNVCNNNTTDGIRVVQVNSEDNIITGNICMDNGGDGIDISSGVTGCIVTGNKLKGNAGSPISADAAGARENRIYSNYHDGTISVPSESTITIPAWVGSGEHIKITGTTQIDQIKFRHNGFVIVLHLSTSITIGDSSLRSAGTFSATADDTITFQYDATDGFWRELSRSAN